MTQEVSLNFCTYSNVAAEPSGCILTYTWNQYLPRGVIVLLSYLVLHLPRYMYQLPTIQKKLQININVGFNTEIGIFIGELKFWKWKLAK